MPANNDTDEIKKYEQYQKSLDSLEGDALLDAINNMAEEEVVGIDESDEYSDTDKNDVLQKISDTPVIDVDDYSFISIWMSRILLSMVRQKHPMAGQGFRSVNGIRRIYLL